jgi:hypothetical protein
LVLETLIVGIEVNSRMYSRTKKTISTSRFSLIITLVFCFPIYLGNVAAAENVELSLKYLEGSQQIEISLTNNGDTVVIVSNDLGLNVSNNFGLNEINLNFTDETGGKYFSENELRSAPSGDTVKLMPGFFIGRSISLASLVPIYKLSPGAYRVTAIYCLYARACRENAGNRFSNKLISNEIKVTIPNGFGDVSIIGVRNK